MPSPSIGEDVFTTDLRLIVEADRMESALVEVRSNWKQAVCFRLGLGLDDPLEGVRMEIAECSTVSEFQQPDLQVREVEANLTPLPVPRETNPVR